MTRRMRDVLENAVRQELRRVDREAWPAAPNTLAALVRQGFLSRSERLSRQGHRLTVWTATDAGKVALRAPERVAVERPRYPSRWSRGSGDYSFNPARSSDWDPVMGALEAPDKVAVSWRVKAEGKRQAAQDRRRAARRVSRSLRAA